MLDIKHGKKFLNTSEAAEYLGLKPQTLANWRHLRKGPDYHMFGSRPMYSKAGLNEYAESNRIRLSV